MFRRLHISGGMVVKRRVTLRCWAGLLALSLLALGAIYRPSLPVAAVAPSSGVIAAKTRWAATYYTQDSGVTGPTVVVVGGVHGDEPAGSWAAYEIHHWPLRCGKLTVLPRANTPGIKEHLHGLPNANNLSEGEKKTTVGNLDRQFPTDEGGALATDSPVGDIWQLISHTAKLGCGSP